MLDVTNCHISDCGGAKLVDASGDVPVVVFNRNPIGEITFAALMRKFRLGHDDDGQGAYELGLDALPNITPECVRMLAWGLSYISTSEIGINLFQLPFDPDLVLPHLRFGVHYLGPTFPTAQPSMSGLMGANASVG